MSKKKEDFLTVFEVSDIFSVHPNTIYKAIRSGKIQAFKVGSGIRSSWRICRTELTRMREFDSRKIIDAIVEKELKKRKGGGPYADPRENNEKNITQPNYANSTINRKQNL